MNETIYLSKKKKKISEALKIVNILFSGLSFDSEFHASLSFNANVHVVFSLNALADVSTAMSSLIGLLLRESVRIM